MRTLQEQMDGGNPNSVGDGMRRVKIGTLLRGLIPQVYTRANLASSATHVETAGEIIAVVVSNNTKVLVYAGDTAAAGEVKVTYDSEGVPTLVFGDGALTGYVVVKKDLPTYTEAAGLAALLDLEGTI